MHHLVNKYNFDNIKMHGTNVKKKCLIAQMLLFTVWVLTKGVRTNKNPSINVKLNTFNLNLTERAETIKGAGIRYFFKLWRKSTPPPPPLPSGTRPHYRGFKITLRLTTVGRTPLDEWSVRRGDPYLTTHNTHNIHPCPRRDSNPQSHQARGRRPTP